MTARQRSRHDAKFTEDLLVLPEGEHGQLSTTTCLFPSHLHEYRLYRQ